MFQDLSSDIHRNSAPRDFGEKLSICEAKIGPSVLESVVPSLNLILRKIPESVLAHLPSLPDLRTHSNPRQNDQNGEMRVVDLITTISLSVTESMPEAPPCRARLVLVSIIYSKPQVSYFLCNQVLPEITLPLE